MNLKIPSPFRTCAFLGENEGGRKFISDHGLAVFELAKQKVDSALEAFELRKLRAIVDRADLVHDILVFQVGNYLLFERELDSSRFAKTEDDTVDETVSKKFRLEAIDSARDLLGALEKLESFGVGAETLSVIVDEIRAKSEQHHVLSTYLRSMGGVVRYFFGDNCRMDLPRLSRSLDEAHEALFLVYTDYILNRALGLEIAQQESGIFCRAIVRPRSADEDNVAGKDYEWFKKRLKRYAFETGPSDPVWEYWRKLLIHESLLTDPLAERFLKLIKSMKGEGNFDPEFLNPEEFTRRKILSFKKNLKSLARLK